MSFLSCNALICFSESYIEFLMVIRSLLSICPMTFRIISQNLQSSTSVPIELVRLIFVAFSCIFDNVVLLYCNTFLALLEGHKWSVLEHLHCYGMWNFWKLSFVLLRVLFCETCVLLWHCADIQLRIFVDFHVCSNVRVVTSDSC